MSDSALCKAFQSQDYHHVLGTLESGTSPGITFCLPCSCGHRINMSWVFPWFRLRLHLVAHSIIRSSYSHNTMHKSNHILTYILTFAHTYVHKHAAAAVVDGEDHRRNFLNICLVAMTAKLLCTRTTQLYGFTTETWHWHKQMVQKHTGMVVEGSIALRARTNIYTPYLTHPTSSAFTTGHQSASLPISHILPSCMSGQLPIIMISQNRVW